MLILRILIHVCVGLCCCKYSGGVEDSLATIHVPKKKLSGKQAGLGDYHIS